MTAPDWDEAAWAKGAQQRATAKAGAVTERGGVNAHAEAVRKCDRRMASYTPAQRAWLDAKWRNFAVEEARLVILLSRRDEMIQDLIKNRRFNPKGAVKAVDNFLATMRYVLEQTGSLPRPK